MPRRVVLRRIYAASHCLGQAESSVLRRLANLMQDTASLDRPKRPAHDVKGTFGTIGAMILGQMASSGEDAGLAGNDATARELVQPLTDEAQRPCTELPPKLAQMQDGKQFRLS